MKSAPVVIDASLLAAFLLREPEGAKFDPVLALVAKGSATLHVPILLDFELTNIIVMAERRGRIPKMAAESIFDEWAQIPLCVDSTSSTGIRLRILELSRSHRLTGYDATYLELAIRLGAPLLTLDQDLLRLKRSDSSIE